MPHEGREVLWPLRWRWGHQGGGLWQEQPHVIQQQVRKPGQVGQWLRVMCGCAASQDLQLLLHCLALNWPEACSKPSYGTWLRDSGLESCLQPCVKSHRLQLPCCAVLGSSLATAALGEDQHLHPQFTVRPLSASWFSLPSVAVTRELMRCTPASCYLLLGLGQKGRGSNTFNLQHAIISSSLAYVCFPGLAAAVRTKEESGMCLPRSDGCSEAKGWGLPRPIVKLKLQCWCPKSTTFL